ncbi:hypothetical protein JX265_009501 [Neoarthrinium moseri]|uniref:Ankyrin n=1 Tax=Neoarthrinium moseri TaxID=1658444 RepID=A0A9P9WG48_9PEZI|nr:hypothetical protein JX265_009501 [Neoarthrinium moseri]
MVAKFCDVSSLASLCLSCTILRAVCDHLLYQVAISESDRPSLVPHIVKTLRKESHVLKSLGKAIAARADIMAVIEMDLSVIHPSSHLGVSFYAVQHLGSALHFAAARGFDEVIRLLLERHTDVNAVNTLTGCGGFPPLFLALYLRQESVPMTLFRYGAQPIIELQGTNALHLAAFTDNQQVMEYLVQQWQVPIDCVDAQGWTPLHYAIVSSNSTASTVRCLVRLGANVNSTIVYDSQTSLDIACRMGRYDLAHELLQSGADVRGGAVDDGSTLNLIPAQLAMTPLQAVFGRPDSSYEKQSLILELLEKGADVDGHVQIRRYSSNSWTGPLLLSLIIENRTIDIQFILKETKANINTTDSRDKTCLEYTLSPTNFKPEIARILLKAGATISRRMLDELERVLERVALCSDRNQLRKILSEAPHAAQSLEFIYKFNGNTPYEELPSVRSNVIKKKKKTQTVTDHPVQNVQQNDDPRFNTSLPRDVPFTTAHFGVSEPQRIRQQRQEIRTETTRLGSSEGRYIFPSEQLAQKTGQNLPQPQALHLYPALPPMDVLNHTRQTHVQPTSRAPISSAPVRQLPGATPSFSTIPIESLLNHEIRTPRTSPSRRAQLRGDRKDPSNSGLNFQTFSRTAQRYMSTISAAREKTQTLDKRPAHVQTSVPETKRKACHCTWPIEALTEVHRDSTGAVSFTAIWKPSEVNTSDLVGQDVIEDAKRLVIDAFGAEEWRKQEALLQSSQSGTKRARLS